MTAPYSPYRYTGLKQVNWAGVFEDLEREKGRATATRELTDKFTNQLFQFPPSLAPDNEAARSRKRVCVIGGGIAGLTAAYELLSARRRSSARHSVTVLEAAGRFGGRIRTHRFRDGTYGELGAMRIPANHRCVTHYLDKFALARRLFVSSNDGAYFHLRQNQFRQYEWEDHFETLYKISTSEVKDAGPHQVFDRLIGELAPPISKLDAVFDDLSVDDPTVAAVEGISLWQLLGERRSGQPPRLPGESYEYISRASGAIWFEPAAALQFYLNELPLKAPEKLELVGGMETLVTAFLQQIDSLGVAREAHARVTNVKLRESDLEVTWLTPCGPRSGVFDYVICTVPAASTARINFDPPLSPLKYEALTNVSYASAGKTIIHCTQRHWESIDHIYGGGTYTDLANQQCWYPSDNSTPDPNAPLNFGSNGGGQPQPAMWQGVSVTRSLEPAVFTAAYMWGANARRFAALDNSQRTELILSCVEKIHPEVRKYISDVELDIVHHAWDAERTPEGGAFAFFAPGEQRRYQAALCEPHRLTNDTNPRIFFAGEHVAIIHAWIQSAIQSALASVMDVLAAP